MVSRWALAFIFAAAVYGKFGGRSRFTEFRRSLRDLFSFGPLTSTGVGGAIVAAEAAIAVLMAIPATVPAGHYLAGTVLLVFCAGIARAIRSGTAGQCLCFGSSSAPLSTRHLVRNALVLTIVAAGLAAHYTASSAGLEPGAMALSAAVGAVLALITVSFDDLTELFFVRQTPARNGR